MEDCTLLCSVSIYCQVDQFYIAHFLSNLYSNSVCVAVVSQWMFGDERNRNPLCLVSLETACRSKQLNKGYLNWQTMIKYSNIFVVQLAETHRVISQSVKLTE